LSLGDLNLSTKKDNFSSNPTYAFIKQHPFGLRSVLNDDVSPEILTGGEMYTKWTARFDAVKKSSESTRKSDEKAGSAATTLDLLSEIDAAIGGAGNDEEKLGETGSRKEHVTKGIVDFIFYSPLRVDQPGFRALGVSDVFDEAQIGRRLLPNHEYPSDHIATVVDLQLLW
jgi:mRNA deadenylase 3'-5' endonuclease subunit Ccr4